MIHSMITRKNSKTQKTKIIQSDYKYRLNSNHSDTRTSDQNIRPKSYIKFIHSRSLQSKAVQIYKGDLRHVKFMVQMRIFAFWVYPSLYQINLINIFVHNQGILQIRSAQLLKFYDIIVFSIQFLISQYKQQSMNFLEKLKQDKWFALANCTLIGIVSYLIYDNRRRKSQRNLKSNHSLQNDLKQKFQLNIHRNLYQYPIYKICVTGGPCGGKTTSIQSIKQYFTGRGFKVFVVPQIPTMIVSSGGMILMQKLNATQRIRFQTLLINLQVYIEDYFTKIASMSKSPSIILCDRGVMDPYAYVTHEQFQTILDQQNWNIVNLRDKRYDSIIFLVTAADGAQQHYTLANNIVRSQGLETARQLDKKTQIAWSGHPHLSIIPNVKGETFKQKVHRAINIVQRSLGFSTSSQFNKKILINSIEYPKQLKKQVFEVEQTFLIIDDKELYSQDKIRKRGQNGTYTYSRTFRYNNKFNGEKDEIKRPLTSMEYFKLLTTRKDKNFKTVKKQRITFIYEKQSFIVDKILVQKPILLLRFASNKEEQNLVKIPGWIQLAEDVTTKKQYLTYQLAKI